MYVILAGKAIEVGQSFSLEKAYIYEKGFYTFSVMAFPCMLCNSIKSEILADIISASLTLKLFIVFLD